MEAWDILIGDGAALRSAAVQQRTEAKTLLISSSLGNGGSIALDGLATSIQEMNNQFVKTQSSQGISL